MRYPQWQLKRSVERRYGVALARMIEGLRTELSRVRSPFLLAAAIRRYARSPTYQKAAVILARSMATHVFSDGHRTWREAARSGAKGRVVYNALQTELGQTAVGTAFWDVVDHNAEIIRSMPERVAKQVTEMVAREANEGLRPEAIMEDVLGKWPHMTRAHAMLIARTESSKASTALTQARSEAAGIRWYVWRSEEDSRVRDSHRLMDGVLINWDDPPSPEALAGESRTYGNYHAGDIFNCRCYPEPLIMFSDIRWPHKVYYGGRIQMMTLAQFKAIGGAAAA